jgi:hypothetical protein
MKTDILPSPAAVLGIEHSYIAFGGTMTTILSQKCAISCRYRKLKHRVQHFVHLVTMLRGRPRLSQLGSGLLSATRASQRAPFLQPRPSPVSAPAASSAAASRPTRGLSTTTLPRRPLEQRSRTQAAQIVKRSSKRSAAVPRRAYSAFSFNYAAPTLPDGPLETW